MLAMPQFSALRDFFLQQITSAVTFLLDDEFTTSASAPLTSPRTCEPGPGTLTLTQTAGQYSTTGGELIIPVETGDATGAGLNVYSGSNSRTQGLAALIKIQVSSTAAGVSLGFGWFTATPPSSSNQSGVLVMNGSNLQDANLNGLLSPISANTYYWLAIIQTANGYLEYVKIGSNWNLVFYIIVATTPIYAGLYQRSASKTGKAAGFRIAQMAGPFATEFGESSFYSASPTAGTNGTGAANALSGLRILATAQPLRIIASGSSISAWIGNTTCSYASATFQQTATTCKVIVSTSSLVDFAIRWTDDNNCWIIRCDKTNSLLSIIEKNGGTETSRASVTRSLNTIGLVDMFSFPITPDAAGIAQLEAYIA